MRVDVHKFLLFGSVSQKKEFFKKAQKLGVIEFIDPAGQKFDIVPESVKQMNKALRILRGVVLEKQIESEKTEEARQVASEICLRQERLEKLFEERRVLTHEMNRVAVFGDFKRSDIDQIEKEGNCVIQFFFCKNKKKVPNEKELFYIGNDHDLYYFISINKEKKEYKNLIEMRVEHSHNEIKAQKEQVAAEIYQIEQRLKKLSAYKTLIKQAIIEDLNTYNLQLNQNCVDYHWQETFFSTEIWVSKTKVKEVERLLESFSIYMSQIAIDPNEKIPTHLENHGLSRVGEDLVYVYDVPSIQDKDPSSWVLWAFAFFFAFIVGDGGYGFVFLILALLIRWKVKKPTPSVLRFNKLLTILAVSCIVWGCCVTSFFGIDFSLENQFKRYSPLSMMVEKKLSYHMEKNDQTYQEAVQQFPHLKEVRMPYEFLTQAVKDNEGKVKYVVYDDFAGNIILELALFVGTIHLIMSMIRGFGQSWARLGWIFFLIGGYLYFPDVVRATSLIHYAFGVNKVVAAFIGPYILLGGIALAIILSICQNKWKGLSEPMTGVEVFADVLSYLRLYALALAGSIMANTFNMFGSKMPIAIGIFVVILGHGLNIVLSVMGGVIHGLRLNFLEWYHYSFEGEGKKHKPLALLQFRK